MLEYVVIPEPSLMISLDAERVLPDPSFPKNILITLYRTPNNITQYHVKYDYRVCIFPKVHRTYYKTILSYEEYEITNINN